MPPVNKDHARDIARKVNDPGKNLRAKVDKTPKAHDLVEVYYKGTRIASFGIRRSPRRDQGHGHIPKDLHLSPNQTIRFAQCHLTVDEWLDILREAHEIDDDGDSSEEPETSPETEPEKPT